MSTTAGIGEQVIWRGRLYVLEGVDPMSLPARGADLYDPDRGRRLRAPLTEVRRLPVPRPRRGGA